MNRNENNTLDDILSAAKAEFSEKGFQSASLRRIVKNAGVTTGAFYGYLRAKRNCLMHLSASNTTRLWVCFAKRKMLLQGFRQKNRFSKWTSFPARE